MSHSLKQRFTLARAPLLLAGLIIAATPAHATGIRAGTLIENTATATYEDGGVPQTIQSNTVRVRVDELLDVTVTSLDPGAQPASSGSQVLSFEVTNQGNGPEAFTLTANPAVSGNDFDTQIDDLAVDTNGNGVYDPGVDTILSSPATTPVLAPDEAITVFVIATIPDSVGDREESSVELTATAVTGSGEAGTAFAGQGEGGGDAITGATTASARATGSFLSSVGSLQLTKSVTLLDPFGGDSAVPGTIATFTLVANTAGSGSLEDVVISDVIPTGTTYVADSLTLDTASLTDASGDDAGEASNTAGIRVELNTLNVGDTHTITFDVTID